MSVQTWNEEQTLEGGYDRALIRWVLGYARPHWRALAGSLLLLLVLTALQLAQPLIISRAIDTVIRPAGATGARTAVDEAKLWPYVWLYLAVVIGAGLLHYVQLLWLFTTGQRIITQIREDVYGHLQSLHLAFFDHNPTGRLVTRVTNDVEALNEVYTSVLVNLFRDIFYMGGASIILWRLNARLALVAFAMLPVVAVTAFVFRRFSRAGWRDVRTRLAQINATLAETFSGMRVIQLSFREHRSAQEFRTVNDDYYRATRRLILIFSIFSPSLDLLTTVTLAGIVWFGGGAVLQHAITLGTLYAFTAFVRRLFEPVNALAEKFNILQAALAAAERITQFMNTEPAIQDPTLPHTPSHPAHLRDTNGEVPPLAPLTPLTPLTSHEPLTPRSATASLDESARDGHAAAAAAVAFDHVSFAYTPDQWVLKDVSFSVAPGETVAFVGHTGAGKSTIMNLLPRLYDVQKGAVRVNGVDVRDWPQAELRRNVGVVMQDVFLFAGDIAANIHLGAPAIDRAGVERAAEIVGADAFIRRLPAGYDEAVVERGMTLSTGQRQLIAFARALAANPPILVLDEATASIDTETEAALQHAMLAVARGRTTLVVAHRLSTIQSADRIYVMDHGRIVETGRHDSLLALGGLYRTLWELQFPSAD